MLNIAMTHALMGKLSNNIEHHGAEDVNAFDLPISEIELSQEELNQLFGDAHACAALYNTTHNGDIEPAIPMINPISLHESFDSAVVAFKIGTLDFTLQECKISKVEVLLQRGGVSKLSFSLRVRPEKDKQILAFLGHQNREIQLDVQDAKIAQKGGRKQPDMFEPGSEPEIGSAQPGTLSEAQIGQAQADALTNSTPADPKAAKKSRRGAAAAH